MMKFLHVAPLLLISKGLARRLKEQIVLEAQQAPSTNKREFEIILSLYTITSWGDMQTLHR
jgi:hypothetical protein